jgi:hypothetical protein
MNKRWLAPAGLAATLMIAACGRQLTYSGDSAPGQAKGNGLNLSGGVWHEVTASGAAAPASSKSASSGGGYGY